MTDDESGESMEPMEEVLECIWQQNVFTHRELGPLVDHDAGALQARPRRLHLGRVEVGCHRADVGHVRRPRYVGVVAQDVHGVLAGSRWPVRDVRRPVAVVLAVDLRLRRPLDREACVDATK